MPVVGAKLRHHRCKKSFAAGLGQVVVDWPGVSSPDKFQVVADCHAGSVCEPCGLGWIEWSYIACSRAFGFWFLISIQHAPQNTERKLEKMCCSVATGHSLLRVEKAVEEATK